MTSSTATRPGRSRRLRDAAVMSAMYAAFVVAACGLYLAYRVHSYHATFAQRGFFWIGSVHCTAPMGFRMRPNRSGCAVLNGGVADPARRIPVRTDAYGLRIPFGRDPGQVAAGGIAAIGCSFTFAHGVAAESSYVEVAGRILGLRASNLGVCAYSAVTSALLLEQEIDRLKPRAVVYGFGNFHLERAANPRADSDLFQARAVCRGGECEILPPVLDNRLLLDSAPVIEQLYYEPRLAGQRTPLSLTRARALVPLAFQDFRRALLPSAWKVRSTPTPLPDTVFCRFMLNRMYGTCHAHGADFVLLWFPKEFGDRPAPGLVAAVAEMQDRDDFTFVDCSPGLYSGVHDQTEYGARWEVPRDGHPNRFMHEEMGRAVAAALATKLSRHGSDRHASHAAVAGQGGER